MCLYHIFFKCGFYFEGDSWAKVKVSPAITPASPDKVLLSGTQLSNFEAVRAKLAEATKTRDKLGRPLLFGKNKGIFRNTANTFV